MKEHETFLKEADERDLAIRQQVAIKGCLAHGARVESWTCDLEGQRVIY